MTRALEVALILVLAGDAWATSWMKPSFELTREEAVEDMFVESDAVIVGRIVRIDSGMEPFLGGGFTWHRRLHIAVEEVRKGKLEKNRIELEPGEIEDLSADSFELWRRNGTHVVFFLMDVSQRKLERKHPDSSAIAMTHEWGLLGRVPGYGVPVLDASSDLARFAKPRSLESLAKEADLIVLGSWVPGGAPCKAPGRPGWCSQIRVRRVLKGTIAPGLVTAFGRGFAIYPDPATGAIFFLRRQESSTFEILHLSAGVRSIRGRRLRQDELSVDEAIARIQAAVDQYR